MSLPSRNSDEKRVRTECAGGEILHLDIGSLLKAASESDADGCGFRDDTIFADGKCEDDFGRSLVMEAVLRMF